jgi:tetratricopeptide (TPR) repeat protein
MQEYFFQKQLDLTEVVAFYDEDVELQRSGYLGLPVYSPGHLPRAQNDLIIILAAGAILGKDLRDTNLSGKYSTLLHAASLIIDPIILWRAERLNIIEWYDIYDRVLGRNLRLFEFVARVQKSNIKLSSASLSALEKHMGQLEACDRPIEQEYLYLFQNFSRLRNFDGAKEALRQWGLSYKKSLMRELMEGLLFSEFFDFSAAKSSWERAERLGPTPKYFWPKIVKTYENLQVSPPALIDASVKPLFDQQTTPVKWTHHNSGSNILSHHLYELKNQYIKLFASGQLDKAYGIKKELFNCVLTRGGRGICYDDKLNYAAALLELGDYSVCISALD